MPYIKLPNRIITTIAIDLPNPIIMTTEPFFVFQLYDCSNELILQDPSGIFWDNDSLAALLAAELNADLLIMLSDVEGLYSGPPSDPQSKIIHTYVNEKHAKLISFGEKSRVGRGGMQAKVFAAANAASKGVPVVIARFVKLF